MDMHVVSLTYKLVTDNSTSFINCDSIKLETEIFNLELNDGILTCYLNIHYDTEELARQVIDKYLKSWEIDYALRYGRGEIYFQFVKSNVIYREPDSPGTAIVYVKAFGAGVAIMTAQAHIIRCKYPSFPEEFIFNPDVEALWNRYEMYLDGKERLPTTGYFCLTYFDKFLCKSRAKALEKFKISHKIFTELSKVTSNKGDAISARECISNMFEPLTEKDNLFIEACIRMFIHRLGEYAAGAKLSEITMADLPSID